jgi:hypothetical protein
MFQAANLQNMENFRHHEGHKFKFQISGDWKLWKYEIESGPLFSHNGRLTIHTSHSRARDTMRGDAVVIICRRWPPPADPHCLIPYSISLPRHRASLCSASGPPPLANGSPELQPPALWFLSLWALPRAHGVFPLGFVARASPFRPLHRIPSLTSTDCRWAPSSVLLITGQGVLNVLGPLAQLGSQFWSTFFHYSGVSLSTLSSSTVPPAPLVSTTVSASPPRFSCSEV